jgi:hypothetical protein
MAKSKPYSQSAAESRFPASAWTCLQSARVMLRSETSNLAIMKTTEEVSMITETVTSAGPSSGASWSLAVALLGGIPAPTSQRSMPGGKRSMLGNRQVTARNVEAVRRGFGSSTHSNVDDTGYQKLNAQGFSSVFASYVTRVNANGALLIRFGLLFAAGPR